MFDLLRLPLLQKAEVKTPEPKERKPPWNKGVAVGKKKPLSRDEVKCLYDILAKEGDLRELALFTLGVDSMLRSGDLLGIRVRDVRDSTNRMRGRPQIMQGKTGRSVTCILGKTTQDILKRWISGQELENDGFLFGGKYADKPLTRRRYQDIVKSWMVRLKLPPEDYGTHSLRRTKASMLYSVTKDSAKVQIVLGQSTLSAAQEYLGVGKNQAFDSLSQIELF